MSESQNKIFDPGLVPGEIEELYMVSKLLALVSPAHHVGVASITSGYIIESGSSVPLDKVLWDTGAMHSSYISTELVDLHRENWKHRIVPMSGIIRLGDCTTIIPVTERIHLPVKFIDSSGKVYKATVDFCVWNSPDLHAIIGLPDIIKFFLPYFFNVLSEETSSCNVLHTATTIPDVLDISTETGHKQGDLLDPWTSTLDLADEELESEEPCSFTQPLYFMTKSRAAILADYREWQEKNISPAFRGNPELLALLNSPESLEVFVPTQWRGIQHMEPVELEFLPTLPAEYKPHWRWLNPKVKEAAMKELERLCEYMYVDSDSPIASPLVVAPKATSPFVRICGDYVWINKHIVSPHHYIPHVQHELELAAQAKFYLDLDMAHAFHQIPLGPHTSRMLSVATPMGLKRPVFLPEGVSPASGILQKTVMSLFSHLDWVIALFDNILIPCDSLEDALVKLKIVIDICYTNKVVLKFSKSYLLHSECKFFGYKVTPGRYELDADRKDNILQAPMPNSVKGMQRFLGAAIFFSEFVPNFAGVTARLYDMTKGDFNWKRSTWSHDYDHEFLNVKEALVNSTAKYFPDYSADWILRTDASNDAVCAVLLQISTLNEHTAYLPIAFKSKKFSGPAQA